ncbi:MAG: type II toxin-antitoxin system PrlF family antitoxin [Chloroflexota bacterium]|nr:type II toxin-antitoxin system PrlF family antitoxin [Chloroflexia bacterium]MDQ3225869.1 type II toxin-antitoxin system PrlF family antitoxin [Chloroflexota bacterium]
MRQFVSSVTSKGQVTIPAAVRKHLGVGTPDKITFVLEDNGSVALQPTKFTIRQLRGIVPALSGRTTSDFEDQIEEAMEEEAARITAATPER